MNLNKFKRILCLAIIVILTFTGCMGTKDNEKEKSTSDTGNTSFIAEEYNVAMLKGPTAMGFVKVWDDSDEGISKNKYNVSVHGTADEIIYHSNNNNSYL